MITNIYTVYDKVAEEAGPLFQAKNLLVAKRYVNEMVKGTKIDISEYELVRVGSFDSESSDLKIVPSPIRDSIPLSDLVINVDDSKEFIDLNSELSDIKEAKN